jgi:PAS domain-containing protein
MMWPSFTDARLDAIWSDGSRVDVSISLSPLTDGFGRTIAVTGMTRDISATKQADRALRASEEQYRRIVETAFEGIWHIGANDRTTFVNRRMADMLGCSVEEMMSRPVTDFMDADQKAQFAANLELRHQDSSRMTSGSCARTAGFIITSRPGRSVGGRRDRVVYRAPHRRAASESTLQRFPVIVLCAYDVRAFDGVAVVEALKVHSDIFGPQVGYWRS